MPRLGELLVQAGAITTEQLSSALRVQRSQGGRLGSQLVEMGILSESALARTLSAQLRLPAVSAAALEKVTPEIVALLPRDSAAHYRAVPVRIEGSQLWVAMSDPTDGRSITGLESATRRSVRPMVAPDVLISYALERHYGVPHRRGRRVDTASNILIDPELAGASRISDVPTPYEDPYSPSQRAVIDARAVDLDARPAVPMAPPPVPVAPVAAKQQSAAITAPSIERFGGMALSTRLSNAASQRDVFEAALTFVGQDFQKQAVLVVRGPRLAGFMGGGRGVLAESVAELGFPVSEIAVIGKVLTDGRPRIGRASQQTLGPIVKALGAPGERAALVLPVRQAGHPVALVVCTEGREGVEALIEEYEQAAVKLDLALQLLAVKKKLLEA